MTSQHPATAKMIAEVVSAVLGMLGSWLLARRYAREPIRALFFAAIWPFLIPFGGKRRLHEFLTEKINLNNDVPDSPVGMVLGLNCLFVAFLLQLLVVYLEAHA